jgi:integrase
MEKNRLGPLWYALENEASSLCHDDWFEAVLPHCNFRLATTLLLLTLTGARVQEACDIEPEDVDIDRAEVILRHTKNGTARRVKLAPVLCDALGKRVEDAKKRREKMREQRRSSASRSVC